MNPPEQPQPPPAAPGESFPPPVDPYSEVFEAEVEKPRDEVKLKFLQNLLTDTMNSEETKEVTDIVNDIIEEAVSRVSLDSAVSDSHVADDTEAVTSGPQGTVLVEEASRDQEDAPRAEDSVTVEWREEGPEASSPLQGRDTKDEEARLELSDVENKDEGAAPEVKVEEVEVRSESLEVRVEEVEERSECPEVKVEEVKDYPEDLNPFGEDEEGSVEAEARPPVPAARSKAPRRPLLNKEGKKIIEAPPNPFWSDGEPSSEEESSLKPVAAPRTSLRTPLDPRFGSSTSLSSLGSVLSSTRRKKGPAPLPPPLQSPASSASSASTPSGYGSRSPVTTARHRKSRPAPPPPIARKLDYSEKHEKNSENKLKQNQAGVDKSEHGKWKRKKGQAPGLPVPQRRRIPPGLHVDVARELDDLEVQQAELERQGVNVEQAIRKYEFELEEEARLREDPEAPEALPADPGPSNKDSEVEGLVLQLFDIVNQKNELFRKQAELMQLRRAQRLEEEHADLEYQIRCLMGRPERNKTDTDKAQEEELIARLVRVVERRNQIVDSLDMDRRRETEEDLSIQQEMERLSNKGQRPEDAEDHEPSSGKTSSKKILKFVKKKKKKEKEQEKASRKRLDADKDIDEAARSEEEVKTVKTKKKWFLKS